MPDEQMQMMEGMGGTMMLVCMVATTLFVLAVLVTIIVQAVLQSKILRELRELRTELPRLHQTTETQPTSGGRAP